MWLPINVHTVPHVTGDAAPPGDPRLTLPAGTVPPDFEDMGAWGEAEYELTADVAGALGFSLERNSGKTMRILERFHAAELTSVAGVPIRIGVAVRLTARRSGDPDEGSDGASLSVLASRADAGGDRPAGTVSVLGFSHPHVAELIPGEVDVDIDGYTRLMSAVDGIQHLVADNPKHVRPAVIARFEPDSESPPLDSDVTLGMVWGLARLAKSVSLAETKTLLTDDLKANLNFENGVRRAYRAVMGGVFDGAVNAAHAADAERRLHAISVTGPLTPVRPIPPRPIP